MFLESAPERKWSGRQHCLVEAISRQALRELENRKGVAFQLSNDSIGSLGVQRQSRLHCDKLARSLARRPTHHERVGSPSRAFGAAVSARSLKMRAMPSAWIRLPQNARVSSDSRSTHCASSMTHNNRFRALAAFAARLMTPRPTRYRSVGGPDAKAEGGVERVTLRRRQAGDLVQDRRQQTVQRSERQSLFGLDSGEADNQEVVGAGDRVVEEGCLADARLALDHQCATEPFTRSGEHPVQHLALLLPPEEDHERDATRG